MTAPEFSFITFDGSDYPVLYRDMSDIAFQVISNDPITSMRMIGSSGNFIEEASETIMSEGNVYAIRPVFASTPDCFKIQLMSGEMVLGESNTFVFDADEKYSSQIAYRCEESDFGFVYCPIFFINSVRLPFYIHEPQYSQARTIYRKRNGRIKTISASIGEDSVLETDYLARTMHKKLIVALSHDEIFINGELLSLTADYQIDWENYLVEKDEKTAKGECAMSANIVNRNSNCGSRCASDDFDAQPRSLYVEAV